MQIKYEKLDIGCGSKKCEPDATGIDLMPGPGVNLVGEALTILRNMEANSVGSIYSSHFLEHHNNPSDMLEEMVRVVVPGGQLDIRVPHFSNPWFYSDPTHKTPFGLYTFAYYFKNNIFSRKLPSYCLIDDAYIKTIQLNFGSTRPFYIRHGFKKMIQFLVNASNYTRELYEELFTGIFNCSEIKVIIQKNEQS